MFYNTDTISEQTQPHYTMLEELLHFSTLYGLKLMPTWKAKPLSYGYVVIIENPYYCPCLWMYIIMPGFILLVISNISEYYTFYDQ